MFCLLVLHLGAVRPPLLGHRDVKTTARYARSTSDDQRAALEGADAA